METNLGNALLLLAIGMITVFVILALVMATGSLLIRLTNYFYKEPVSLDRDTFPAKSLAILSAVVDHVTEGKGHISDIKRLN